MLLLHGSGGEAPLGFLWCTGVVAHALAISVSYRSSGSAFHHHREPKGRPFDRGGSTRGAADVTNWTALIVSDACTAEQQARRKRRREELKASTDIDFDIAMDDYRALLDEHQGRLFDDFTDNPAKAVFRMYENAGYGRFDQY